LLDIKADVETGSSLTQAFGRHPLYFDALYCNLVNAGEQAGILDTVLERLATYRRENSRHQGQNKISHVLTQFLSLSWHLSSPAVIMLFVIPAFKELFTSFGADLPAPTLIVMAISISLSPTGGYFGSIGGGLWFFFYTWKRSRKNAVLYGSTPT